MKDIWESVFKGLIRIASIINEKIPPCEIPCFPLTYLKKRQSEDEDNAYHTNLTSFNSLDYSNINIIFKILMEARSMNPALEKRKRQLAVKYIQNSEQREIFLVKATQFKMWANYIAALILTNEGYKEFHITDIRRVLKRLLGDLYDGPGTKLSGLLTQDMADTSNWHFGYPCLKRVAGKRGYYTFIGFTKRRQS
jgi:hypothetical protein